VVYNRRVPTRKTRSTEGRQGAAPQTGRQVHDAPPEALLLLEEENIYIEEESLWMV
jgi:hypothetical protein